MELRNAPNVILDSAEMEKISQRLKSKHIDYHLFFEIVYHTGIQGSKLLPLRAKDAAELINTYKETMPSFLIKEIEHHISKKKTTDWLFEGLRTPGEHLSKRAMENALLIVGREFGYKDFGVKTIARTFFYEQFRLTGYDYEATLILFKKRHKYVGTLDNFLEYCGLTQEEFEADVLRNLNGSCNSLIKDCESIIKFFQTIRDRMSEEDFTGIDLKNYVAAVAQTKSAISNCIDK